MTQKQYTIHMYINNNNDNNNINYNMEVWHKKIISGVFIVIELCGLPPLMLTDNNQLMRT